MKLVKQFNKICSKLAKHVGYDGFIENNQIDTDEYESFWQINDEEITWAENEEDILEETDKVYSSEIKGIFRGVEATLVLVESVFGDGDYWLVLDSNKEIK